MDLINPVKDKFNNIKQNKIDPLAPMFPAMFFVAGFFYDIVTLDRVDSLFGILQQSIFLLLSIAVVGTFLISVDMSAKPGRSLVNKAMGFRNEAIHFCIGSLLSAFTLFYVKSASSLTSFIFIGVFFGVVLFNEKAANTKGGTNLQIKWALISLCLYSFLSYMVPLMVGMIGMLTTILTAIVYCIAIAGVYWALMKLGAMEEKLRHLVLKPSGAVLAIIMTLTWLNWVPPIPLSIQHIGIYHDVKKEGDKYQLFHENPWWRFWHHSDQEFKAQPGDKLYGYARIFSPVGFADNVYFHWKLKQKGKWMTQDRIPVVIRGGRGEGFRAYTFKSNYQAGDWMLFVETRDGREIGRSSFTVHPESEVDPDREFKVRLE